MTETKTTSKTIKTPAEAMQDMNEAGRKVAIAYAEAGVEIGKSFDAMARVAMNHFLGASKESAEIGQSAFEAGVKAREAARKTAVEIIERSFALASK